MTACKKIGSVMLMTLLVMTALIQGAAASEIDLNIPMLDVSYNIWGYATTGSQYPYSPLIPQFAFFVPSG